MINLRTWPGLAIACAVAVVLAIVITAIVGAVLRIAARRSAWPVLLIRNARIPFRLFLLVVVWAAGTIALPPEVPVGWQRGLQHTMLILAIATGVWFVAGLVVFIEDLGLARYRLDIPDNRYARKVRTQVLILRRLTVVAAVLIGSAAVLLTFPPLQAAGASVLASAGVIGIIAGVAAQSSLANLFAGIQLAFSDAIRLDDVVVVEQEWGTIEEITLTYVVVHVWDDRTSRAALYLLHHEAVRELDPAAQRTARLVEFDLDWRVSPGGMRAELNRILATTELWDGRTGVLQVTDAVSGWVRVRILVTARDAPTLFDLRCLVRERLIDWMQRYSPASLPCSRVELVQPSTPTQPTTRTQARTHDDARLFGGSPEKEQRGAQFTEAIPVQNAPRHLPRSEP